MPTVLLLDASLSMARLVPSSKSLSLSSSGNATPASASSTSFKDVAQRGLLQFLGAIEKSHPREQICLMAFSSDARIVTPFTTDFAALRAGVYSITLRDARDVGRALAACSAMVLDKLGRETPTQIILVTAGRPNLGVEASDISLPFPAKLHVVGLGSQSTNHKSHSGFFSENSASFLCGYYEELTQLRNGSFYFVDVLSGGATKNGKLAFDKLAQKHYGTYKGVLSLGHHSSGIGLYPEPSLSFVNKVISAEGQPISLPSILSIVGFVLTKKLSSPPILSHHIVVPMLHTSTTDTATTPNAFVRDPASADESNAALCANLNSALRDTKYAGVVRLHNNWFGLLHAICEDSTSDVTANTVLALYILPPKLNIEEFVDWCTLPASTPVSTESTDTTTATTTSTPTATPTSNAGNNTPGSATPKRKREDREKEKESESGLEEGEEKEKDMQQKRKLRRITALYSPYAASLPVGSNSTNSSSTPLTPQVLATVPYKSYTTAKGAYVIPTVSQETLQSDWAKLSRYTSSLPAKRELLYAETQRLRQIAYTYHFPQLTNNLVRLFEGELGTIRDKASVEAQILRDLVQQITDNPLSVPIVVRELKAVARPPSRMNINSVLN